MFHKLFISANSLKPYGFMGWPDLALAVLKKYSAKVLLTDDSPTRENIQKLLRGKGISIQEEDCVTEIDATDAEVTLLAMEPATSKSIPSIAGRVFGSICAPFSQNWTEQIRVCRERKVTGLISEILPDELSPQLARDALEYFCSNAFFLPPCIDSSSGRKIQDEPITLIIYRDHDEELDDQVTKLRKFLPILENFEQFKFIRHSQETDFGKIADTFGTYDAIYNILHYPQFNFFCKVSSSNQKLLNPLSRHDSPIRNLLSRFKEPTLDQLACQKDISIRAQILQILDKAYPVSPTTPPEILDQFSARKLLPFLEKKLQLSDSREKGSKLEAINHSISWKQLLNSKIHLKRFPFLSDSAKGSVANLPLLHPAGTSSLEGILRTEPNYSENTFINPAFAHQVLELPNAASTTSLFNALLNLNPSKWEQACEDATTSGNALRLGELLYHSCLIAKEQNNWNNNLQIAEKFYEKLIGRNQTFAVKAYVWKAKLALQQDRVELDKEFFPGLEDQLPALASAAHDSSQQELLLPAYRENAKRFLSQFAELFPHSYGEFRRNSQASVAIPCALGETEKAFELTRKLVKEGKTSFMYVLEYLILSYFYTNNAVPVISALDQLGEDFLDFRPFDTISRIYKAVLSCLQGNTDSISEVFVEITEKEKHVSKLNPIFTVFPISMIVLAKALQSSEIEKIASKIGNNVFFDYLDSEDFGQVHALPCNVPQQKLTKMILEFISD